MAENKGNKKQQEAKIFEFNSKVKKEIKLNNRIKITIKGSDKN